MNKTYINFIILIILISIAFNICLHNLDGKKTIFFFQYQTMPGKGNKRNFNGFKPFGFITQTQLTVGEQLGKKS